MRFYKEIKFGLLALASALLLVACNSCESEVEWSDQRSIGSVVGIVNHSLALMYSTRSWGQSDWGMSPGNSGNDHLGLHLINYKTKQKPLWEDTIDYIFDISSQIFDSIVVGTRTNFDEQIILWKIGEKPKTHRITQKQENCITPWAWRTNRRMRAWIDGKILVLPRRQNRMTPSPNGDTCQYALLDTMTWQINMKKFDGNLEWLAQCEDIATFDERIICLKKSNNVGSIIDLVNQNTTLDSITPSNAIDFYNYPLTWLGHFVQIKYVPDSAWNYASTVYEFNILKHQFSLDTLHIKNRQCFSGEGRKEICYHSEDLVQ
jgi:hypothetical protein